MRLQSGHVLTPNINESYVHYFSTRVAPRPSLVFFMIAVKGASRPPDNPIRSPSAQPIAANILNPMFDSPIFGAA